MSSLAKSPWGKYIGYVSTLSGSHGVAPCLSDPDPVPHWLIIVEYLYSATIEQPN